MKYFIVAGEPSGDLHGSNLIREIKKLDTTATFEGMGGKAMIDQGLKPHADMRDHTVMGFVEVLLNLGRIRKLISTLKNAITTSKPDRLVLIDYGGLNMKLAAFGKKTGVEVHYYILPKVWAWNEGRIKKIERYVDRAYVIFPFEEAYFRKGGVHATYVGNPVVESIERFMAAHGDIVRIPNQIALLPGSRDQEIKRIFPTMLKVAKRFRNYNFVVAAHEAHAAYDIELPENVSISFGDTYRLVAQSRLAVVTSGTANLETALLGTPQIVVYKANMLSYWIGKRLVKVKYISPVNLILNKLLCTELIQSGYNAVDLTSEIERWLEDDESQQMRSGYNELATTLGQMEAAFNTARMIVDKEGTYQKTN